MYWLWLVHIYAQNEKYYILINLKQIAYANKVFQGIHEPTFLDEYLVTPNVQNNNLILSWLFQSKSRAKH
jgi:hypothetical protein